MTNFKRFTAAFMAILLCMSLLVMVVACDPPETPPEEKELVANPETRPLTMSIQNPDGLFNPFFSTSAVDGTVIGMTQIGMLTSTAKGEPKCGDDEPVVVKDYQIKTTSDEKYTDYTFIIKNGIKFSDGQPLTIEDVLFNLYVYLDPVYTGSSTIYSTDIVGLKAYRQQEPGLADDSNESFEDGFILDAMARITEIADLVKAFDTTYNPGIGVAKPEPEDYNDEQILSFWKNIAFTGKEFYKELESDWNNADVESYKDEGFTEKWQVFLYQDGGIDFYLKDKTGKYVKDDEGKKTIDTIEVAKYEVELSEYLRDYKLENTPETVRQWAIHSVYGNYFGFALNLDTDKYDEKVFDTEDLVKIKSYLATIKATRFSSIVSSWMTADTLLNQLVAEAKSEQFDKGGRKVLSISGITSSAATAPANERLEKVSVDFHKNNLGEPHDVLNIRINGIDPKAIWNFSFNIAPMHYYSGTFEGKDYSKSFDASKGDFGFKFGSKKFFDQVLNAPEKVGLPVGAGVYMASTVSGGVAKSGDQFYDNNIVYYERNPYFETLGEGLCNAKIKYFRYKVAETDQVLNSIANGDIDIGEPSATPENIKWLNEKGIAHVEIWTSGYGYVGINPRFVPDIHVRRAIMMAMDRMPIRENYYGKDLCEIINRPMSTTNWAYPNGVTVYSTTYKDKNGEPQDVSYDYDGTGVEIERLLESVGYQKGTDGIYTRRLDDGSESRLSYKFTIAGSSTDHPAYSMFVKAQNLLNQHGFDVKVVTSQQALSDLSSGKLAVWAAAWSSTIDPDMYQVYHKDSNASSVNNWGYPQIKANPTLYSEEQKILEDLSELIDAGRETNDQDARADIYARALDKVMEFAVEMPTYQRKDMTAYNANLLDRNTMTPSNELSPYNGLLSRIWELNYAPKAQ